VDGPAGVGQGAQPAVRLSHQLHLAARAWLHRPREPLHTGAVLPLRGGAPQLCAQCYIVGSHLSRRLRGLLGIPANWDLWVHLFRAELHTPAKGEARVRRAVRVSGLTLTLRDSHKDLYP
jgi:hypothetical protein